MEFKDSQTYQNLLKVYEEELMFSARYELYRETARTDGYMEISRIFDIVSGQDREHARIWLRQLGEGKLPNTAENLLESTNRETAIAGSEYQKYAKVAREEGLNQIAALFSGVANINYYQASLFRQQYDNVVTNQVFCKPEERIWVCMQCGNIMSGTCAPKICPVCGFPQAFYRIQSNCIY